MPSTGLLRQSVLRLQRGAIVALFAHTSTAPAARLRPGGGLRSAVLLQPASRDRVRHRTTYACRFEDPDVLRQTPSIALVHDWLDAPGGGEAVLASLTRLFPEAPVFTLVDFLSP